MSAVARIEAGFLLRRLQRGDLLSMVQSRPMASIGPRCHELRINDTVGTWRVMYRIDRDVIIILEAFAKKTGSTPTSVIETCRKRLKEYDNAVRLTKEIGSQRMEARKYQGISRTVPSRGTLHRITSQARRRSQGAPSGQRDVAGQPRESSQIEPIPRRQNGS